MSTFQINGIGIREFHKTLSAGSFECGNPRCKGKRGGSMSQHYKQVSGRKWFTFLWIPLIPLGGRRTYVQCTACKTAYNPSVVGRRAPGQD